MLLKSGKKPGYRYRPAFRLRQKSYPLLLINPKPKVTPLLLLLVGEFLLKTGREFFNNFLIYTVHRDTESRTNQAKCITF